MSGTGICHAFGEYLSCRLRQHITVRCNEFEKFTLTPVICMQYIYFTSTPFIDPIYNVVEAIEAQLKKAHLAFSGKLHFGYATVAS